MKPEVSRRPAQPPQAPGVARAWSPRVVPALRGGPVGAGGGRRLPGRPRGGPRRSRPSLGAAVGRGCTRPPRPARGPPRSAPAAARLAPACAGRLPRSRLPAPAAPEGRDPRGRSRTGSATPSSGPKLAATSSPWSAGRRCGPEGGGGGARCPAPSPDRPRRARCPQAAAPSRPQGAAAGLHRSFKGSFKGDFSWVGSTCSPAANAALLLHRNVPGTVRTCRMTQGACARLCASLEPARTRRGRSQPSAPLDGGSRVRPAGC